MLDEGDIPSREDEDRTGAVRIAIILLSCIPDRTSIIHSDRIHASLRSISLRLSLPLLVFPLNALTSTACIDIDRWIPQYVTRIINHKSQKSHMSRTT